MGGGTTDRNIGKAIHDIVGISFDQLRDLADSYCPTWTRTKRDQYSAFNEERGDIRTFVTESETTELRVVCETLYAYWLGGLNKCDDLLAYIGKINARYNVSTKAVQCIIVRTPLGELRRLS